MITTNGFPILAYYVRDIQFHPLLLHEYDYVNYRAMMIPDGYRGFLTSSACINLNEYKNLNQNHEKV